MSKLRDNQALLLDVFKLVCEHDGASSTALSFAERVTAREQTAARVLDAIDSALTATWPAACANCQGTGMTARSDGGSTCVRCEGTGCVPVAATGPGSGAAWVEFPGDGQLPAERRDVLVAIAPGDGGHQAATAVGYLRHGSRGPSWVVTGMGRPFTVTHWCDCLGDGWRSPAWPNSVGQHGRGPVDAPQADHRAAPGCRLDIDDCHRENGWPCADHLRRASCATPPSGSPPAVTEPRPTACNCGRRHGEPGPHFIGCAKLRAPAATPGEPVTSASPPESPDGSRGTPPGEVDDQGRVWESRSMARRYAALHGEDPPKFPPVGSRGTR